MEDVYGRTLGEQVRDKIRWEYYLDERSHVYDSEYTSDTSHQDGDLPYRMQITYRDGGPSYYVNDYFPHFHYQAGAVLADEDYDLLTEYWGTRETSLEDLELKSQALEKLREDGATHKIEDLGL